MKANVTTRYRILDSNVQGLYLPTGAVGKKVTHVAREIEALAIVRAPVGPVRGPGVAPQSQKIKSSHHVRGTLKRGRYESESFVYNDAPHAPFVHGGTRTPIAPGRKLRLPAGGEGLKIVSGSKVAGQRANPWLENAGDSVAKKYAG